MITLRDRLIVAAVIVAALAIGVGGPMPGLAQDATPGADTAAVGIPNHIHTGTCDELGDVIAPLANLVSGEDAATGTAATPMAATPMAATAETVPVAVGTTQIDLTLDELLASPHAFNAHDPNDLAIYIGCANIAGTPDEQGNLFVGIEEDSGSGLSGVVWLIDDGTGAGTVVTVFLVGEYESTAAPASDEAATPVG